MASKLGIVGRKTMTVLLALSMLMILSPLFLTEDARADPNDLFIWGIIFDSDGSLLSNDTDFRVWVQHSGTWKGFPSNDTWDVVGTQGGFYSFNLSWEEKGSNWTDGDLYRIQVDCTPSGGLSENTTSNGTGSVGDPVSPRGSYSNELNWLPGGGANNTQQWDVVCSNVDLIPTDIEIDGIPYTPPMGVAPFTIVDISATVTNNGITDISEPNTIVLRNASGIIGQDTATAIAPASSVGPYGFLWNAPDGGYFCFNITVDYYDNVTETNENNNSKMVCFSVGAADLTPSDIQVTTDYPPHFYQDASATGYRSNPIQITPGTTANIFSNVSNVGSLASEICSIDFYNTTSEGGPPSALPFFESAVPSIGAGSHTGPYAGSWQALPPFGYHYVNITADYYDDVMEINPFNNTFILRFLVGYPDYIPSNDTMPLVQNVTAGAFVPIEVIVRNIGLLDALDESTIAFYDDFFQGRFAAQHVLPIAAGDNSSQPYHVDWQAPPVVVLTSVNVTIIVDDTGNVTEMDEFNNATTIQFWVHPGPVTTLVHGTPFFVNGTTLYINSSTTLDFDVQVTTPWHYTMYSIDGGSEINYTATGQFTIPVEGLHDLTFYSVNSLGNVETTHSQEIIVDNSPPITVLNATEPMYYDFASGYTWIKSLNPATPVYLKSERDDEPDLAVGRELTSYRVYNQGWGLWIDYLQGNPLDLGTGDGPRQIEWYSLDRLGNNETIQSFTLYVDDSPPDTSSVIGEPNFERERTIYVETKTEFTLSSNDGGGSGVRRIEYRLDNDITWERYIGPFKMDRLGKHTIHYRGVDNLGNTFEDSQEVFVIGMNWKPLIAIIFITIMIIVGAVVGYKRPLLMVRKKQREVEDALLKEEEEEEEASEVPGIEEYEEVMVEEPAEQEAV